MKLRINEEITNNVVVIEFNQAELDTNNYNVRLNIPITQNNNYFRCLYLSLYGGSTWHWEISLKGFPIIVIDEFHEVEFDVTHSSQIYAQQFINAMSIDTTKTQNIIKNALTKYFQKEFPELIVKTKGKLNQSVLDDIVILMSQRRNMRDSDSYTVNNSIYGFEQFDKTKYKNYNQYVNIKLSEFLDNLSNTPVHLMSKRKLDDLTKDLIRYLNCKDIEATNTYLDVDGIRLKGNANRIARDYVEYLFMQNWKKTTPEEIDDININKVYKKDTIYGVIPGSLKDIKTKPYTIDMGYGSLSSHVDYFTNLYIDESNNILVDTHSRVWD